MTKKEFLKKWYSDYAFRLVAKSKGIKVIQENIFFFNPDGQLKAIANKYIV